MLLLAVALSAFVLVAGKSDGPRITSPKDETVVQKGQIITVICEGEGDLKWKYPEYSLSEVNVTNEYQKTILKRYPANYLDVGYYVCYTENNDNETKDQVYIYVKDEQHPVAMKTRRTILTVGVSGTVIVPCKPTSPDVKLHLINSFMYEEVFPDSNGRVTVSKEGFFIHNVTIADSGDYECCPYGENGLCEEEHTYYIHINVETQSSPLSSPSPNTAQQQELYSGGSFTPPTPAIPIYAQPPPPIHYNNWWKPGPFPLPPPPPQYSPPQIHKEWVETTTSTNTYMVWHEGNHRLVTKVVKTITTITMKPL